jgi:quinol monooxygenase YgiN
LRSNDEGDSTGGKNMLPTKYVPFTVPSWKFLSFPSLALFGAALTFAVAHAQEAAPPSGPMEVAKYVDIQPGQEKAALAALKKYAAAAGKENGNARLIVLQEERRPSRFLVVEKWKDEASYNAHVAAASSNALDSETSAIRRAPNDDRNGFDFLAQDGAAPPSSAVFLVTYVDVNPPGRQQAEVAIRAFADATRKETGSLEFDVFRPKKQANLNHFIMIEAWSDAKALAAHDQAKATLGFRQTVAPLMGALYDDRAYEQVK